MNSQLEDIDALLQLIHAALANYTFLSLIYDFRATPTFANAFTTTLQRSWFSAFTTGALLLEVSPSCR